MKVLFITHSNSLYGANKSLLSLIKDLRDRYKVEPLVLLPEQGEFCRKLKSEGIEYVTMKYYAWRVTQTEQGFCYLVKQLLADYAVIFRFILKLYQQDISMIHSNSSTICLGARLAKIIKKPHIWHIREYGMEDYNIDYIYHKMLVKHYYEAASAVLAISKDILIYNKKRYHLGNIRLVYNGIQNIYEPKESFHKDGKIHFCTVGLIHQNKNQMEVVRACRHLIKEGITSFDYTIVGGGEKNEIRKIKYFINKHGLEEYVKILGYTDKIPDILKNMDVGVVPSKAEAFGRVTVEYMMNSMPVIGANSGGTPELIQHGRNGFLYESGNEMDLKEKMEELIQKRNIVETMGTASKIFADQYFSMKRNTDLIYKIYKKFL